MMACLRVSARFAYVFFFFKSTGVNVAYDAVITPRDLVSLLMRRSPFLFLYTDRSTFSRVPSFLRRITLTVSRVSRHSHFLALAVALRAAGFLDRDRDLVRRPLLVLRVVLFPPDHEFLYWATLAVDMSGLPACMFAW